MPGCSSFKHVCRNIALRSLLPSSQRSAGLNGMQINNRMREPKAERLLATALVVAALAMSGGSFAEVKAGTLQQMVQGVQVSPTPASERNSKPADSDSDGSRPTTPAPPPAHPDPQVQRQRLKTTLPPAPAEKIGPPINQK